VSLRRFLLDVGPDDGWLEHSRSLAVVILPMLHAATAVDLLYLQKHNTPRLYSAGVRYQNEPWSGIEEFASIPVVLARGWGDCDDLAPWRAAELQRQGEAAKVKLKWKRHPRSGARMYHVVVQRENGSEEDPSRILGM
jgi:hypothetical protein